LVIIMAGSGVNFKDEEEVKEYLENLGTEYRFGCYHEKNPKSCHLLGDYMESIKQDFVKASKIYAVNCDDAGHAHSCHKIGGYKFSGRGCERDVEASYNYFAKGCELGYSAACLNAGLLDELEPGTKIGGVLPGKEIQVARSTQGDKLKALDYFQKACEGDVAEGCHRAASMFIQGVKGVLESDKDKAFPLALKGCDLGKLECCVNVSIMYKNGEGVEANPKLFKRYSNMARDIIRSNTQQQNRLRFQEGAETVGGDPVQN